MTRSKTPPVRQQAGCSALQLHPSPRSPCSARPLEKVNYVGQNHQAYDGKEHEDENIQHGSVQAEESPRFRGSGSCKRGGRVARGGARASGEARRATSSASARPRGCGSRGIPRRQRLLLQDEPRGHRPCSSFASAQRCSPGACADSPA